jgi:hypothetical protein
MGLFAPEDVGKARFVGMPMLSPPNVLEGSDDVVTEEGVLDGIAQPSIANLRGAMLSIC